MALTKDTVLDKIEILEGGHIQVRFAQYILEDGERVTDPKYRREAFVPGADVSKQPAVVRQIANLIWTPAVIAVYKAKVAQDVV